MNTLRDVRRRIKTVSNISHLTDAMQKIASFALNKARNRLTNARPYIETTERMLAGLAGGESEHSHPFFKEPPKADSILVIVFSSDKGLCGAYNNNINRAAEKFIRESGKQAKTMVFGRKGVNYFRKRGIELVREWTDTPTFFDFALPRELAETVMDLYRGGQYSGIYLAYTSFISIAKNLPVVKKLLPVEISGAAAKEDLNLYEPGRKQALDFILPEYIRSLALKAMLEASASEHASRTIAMEQATKNAIDMIDELTILGNKLRQAGITRELTDIIGGTENLS
jgi:F-type H+-transporting ATPase subunit gamma